MLWAIGVVSNHSEQLLVHLGGLTTGLSAQSEEFAWLVLSKHADSRISQLIVD